MNVLFKEFDKIQDDGWGYGVFYGTDSNSADHRCIWSDKYKGWDCPSYWVNQNGQANYDFTKLGAGGYDAGNTQAGLGGGGSGCHWNSGGHGIDQWDSDANPNLVQDANCQCNYALKGNGWEDWVKQWIKHGKAKSAFSWMKWFEGGINKAPQWGVDLGICWVNNPRDMIYMQNMIWFHRFDWSNQLIPNSAWDLTDPQSQRMYWGWNEVPVQSKDVNNPANWDSLVIKLPAAICKGQSGGADHIECMDGDAQKKS